jgi:hypothetical protein
MVRQVGFPGRNLIMSRPVTVLSFIVLGHVVLSQESLVEHQRGTGYHICPIISIIRCTCLCFMDVDLGEVETHMFTSKSER